MKSTLPAVIVDTREKKPYSFEGLVADAKDGGGPLLVSVLSATLASGDYSLSGFESRVAIERKSLNDLYGTLGKRRDRFERELVRLNDMDHAAVVIEAEWSEIINDPPARSKLSPKSVFRSIIAWQQRYQRIHWWTVPGREFGQTLTYRILERYHKEQQHNARNIQETATNDPSAIADSALLPRVQDPAKLCVQGDAAAGL